MNNKKDKIFKSATLKLKNSRFLKSLILSSLLLSNAKLTPDLIAEEAKPTPKIETIIDNPTIQIQCEKETENLAKNLKTIINDLENDNPLCYMIVSELEKNNITIQITEPDEYTNGYYIIGSKTIYIPQNQIPTNLNKESKYEQNSLKRTIIHETIHMLQDINGIFEDCKKLSPMDSCIMSVLVELDAICKSFTIQNPDEWKTSDEMFYTMKNIIPCLDNEIKNALNKSKRQIPTLPTITIDSVIQKLNIPGMDQYKDISGIIETIKQNITPEIMNEIILEDTKYKILAQTNSQLSQGEIR